MFSKLCLFLGLLSSCALAQTDVVIVTSETSETNPTTVTCGYNQLNASDVITWNYTNVEGVTNQLESSAVSFNATSVSQAGEYSCIVNAAVVSTTTVAYIDHPKIQNARKSVTFNDGDVNRKLTCESLKSYPAVTFEWTRRGEDENEVSMIISRDTDPNVNITETATTSTILFYNLTYDMQAYYTCKIKNVAGEESVEIIIRVKDRLAALWPFLGIVAEVVILITIIFVYEKRSKKTVVRVDEVKDEAEKPLKGQDGTELRNRVPNNNYK